jgi:hypothetical protein
MRMLLEEASHHPIRNNAGEQFNASDQRYATRDSDDLKITDTTQHCLTHPILYRSKLVRGYFLLGYPKQEITYGDIR